jgi:hypothetical protein
MHQRNRFERTVPTSRRDALASSLKAAACLLLPAPAAHALDKPAGAVLLKLRGRIRMPNAGTEAHYDLPMLEALPQRSFLTRTPWYPQPRRFSGPLLRDVLARAGAQGTLLRLLALNDYRVDMPQDDAQRHDVIVAHLLDDKPMTVRERGPLLVMYPFDAQPELRSAVYYNRSAWQLHTIDVL